MLDQITPLILTYNEAPNIGRVLDRLAWARDILIVDSFSDDETLEIISGYPQARVIQRKFDDFAAQCNYGLKEGGIESEWVLSLDADYILTPELVDELATLKPDRDVRGMRAGFIYCINGKRLRSGIYPPVTVLFRKENAIFRKDGHAHRVDVNGRVEMLSARILHDDRKSLNRWFAAQSRYTELEVDKLRSVEPASLGWKDRLRLWRIVAPPAMLVYCLVVRGGVLDGWAGFYYAFQRALAELMLSLRISDFEFRNSNFPQANTTNEHPAKILHPAIDLIRNPKSEIRNSETSSDFEFRNSNLRQADNTKELPSKILNPAIEPIRNPKSEARNS